MRLSHLLQLVLSYLLLTTYYLLQMGLVHLLLTTDYALLTTYYLLLTTDCLLLTAYYLLLTTHYTLHTTHYTLHTTDGILSRGRVLRIPRLARTLVPQLLPPRSEDSPSRVRVCTAHLRRTSSDTDGDGPNHEPEPSIEQLAWLQRACLHCLQNEVAASFSGR